MVLRLQSLDLCARSVALVLALLCAVIVGTVGHGRPDAPAVASLQQVASLSPDDAEIIGPKQVPYARSEGHFSYGLRGKDLSKSKHDAVPSAGPEGLSWATYRRRNDLWDPVEPTGYVRLRTQNPRAPPLL